MTKTMHRSHCWVRIWDWVLGYTPPLQYCYATKLLVDLDKHLRSIT